MTVHNSAYDLAQLQAIFRDGEEEARLAHVQRLTQQPEDLEERRAVLALLIESWATTAGRCAKRR